MTVKIRLSRAGSKKRPYYHIVVADERAPRDGRYIERIGAYNPMLAKDSGERVKLDKERAEHWLSVGAQATDRDVQIPWVRRQLRKLERAYRGLLPS